jgi:prophage antirepressor-like protein
MITFSCREQNVRALDIGGKRWIAAPDALRVLGVDITRKGASVHLQTLPRTEVQLVTSSEYPLLFAGRRGNPKMNLVTEQGFAMLMARSNLAQKKLTRAGNAAAPVSDAAAEAAVEHCALAPIQPNRTILPRS